MEYVLVQISPPNLEDTDLADAGLFAPTLDVVQDYPAFLDWRLVAAFVVTGIALFSLD